MKKVYKLTIWTLGAMLFIKGAVGGKRLSALTYVSLDILDSILHEFIQRKGKKKR